MSEYPKTEQLTITDEIKWILDQKGTKRIPFAVDATNGAKLVEGCIVALDADGKGVAWGTKTSDAYDYEPYGLLMSTADVTTEEVTLSVLTMGMVDKRRISCVVDGGSVDDAVATLRKNNIIVEECE